MSIALCARVRVLIALQFLRGMGLPADCLLVGSIGELRTLKRHDDFIRAAAMIVAEVSGDAIRTWLELIHRRRAKFASSSKSWSLNWD